MNGICKNCGATNEVENNELEELREKVNKLLTRVEELEAQVERLNSNSELQESVRIWGAT